MSDSLFSDYKNQIKLFESEWKQLSDFQRVLFFPLYKEYLDQLKVKAYEAWIKENP